MTYKIKKSLHYKMIYKKIMNLMKILKNGLKMMLKKTILIKIYKINLCLKWKLK